MSDTIEARIGIEPIDNLLHHRQEKVREFSETEAFRITYNDKRKAYLAIRALQIRDERATAGEKTTEALIDSLAHADDEYRAWLDMAVLTLARREVLKGEIEAIDAEIYRGQALARAYTAEARL